MNNEIKEAEIEEIMEQARISYIEAKRLYKSGYRAFQR